ncbi:MAG: ATP-binding cassette domain-containing protein [Anaerolineaceae bacterium]|nr:ATP-binding cassette domain-containing protein [Anaerolineaceae bacterium]
MAAIVEAQNLVKKFGDFEAVKGISFTVEEGEVFGLLGPNGAGKTTTISMLTGLFPPTSGTARINGHDIQKEPLLAKQMCGLVPQDLALYPTLSARANLDFFGRVYGLSGRKLKENIEDILRVVALTDRADQAIEKYSGGMKRRVNIAAGLVHQPRLLFLDEPTVGVDPQSRNYIFESVQRLNRERGMTIIYTSHYMEEVELLCNRVAIVDQGKLIALDTIKNLVGMLGGGVLRIGLKQADAALLEALSNLPAVQNASVLQTVTLTPPEEKEATIQVAQPVTVKVETKNSQQALIQVINYLEEKNQTLLSLDILENNLESVFLHLTGKQLRE